MRDHDLIFEFETVEDPSLGDGGTGETPPPEPALVVEEPWALTQDQWEQTQQSLQTLGQYAPVLDQLAQRLAPPSYAEPELPEFDPFEPESVSAFVQAAVQQGVKQALGPFEGVLGMVAQSKGEEFVTQEFDRLSAMPEIGSFDREIAAPIAYGLAEQFGAQIDSRTALKMAAERVSAYEKKIRADERAQITGQMTTLAGAPATLNGTAAGATPPAPKTYEEVVARFRERHRNPVLQ